MGDDMERALRFRNYAEELRIIASDKSMPENRQTLRKLADDYEKLAEAMEAVDSSKDRLKPRYE